MARLKTSHLSLDFSCKATEQCPLIDAIHGETKEEARKNFETTMYANRFPVLKKATPFSPKPIEKLEDITTEVTHSKHYDSGTLEEIVWLTHEDETVGYAKIVTREVWWDEEKQEMPASKKTGENKTAIYHTLADFEVRAPGVGHARRLLEKLHETYGDIFTSGGATPDGARFIQNNKDLFRQDPSFQSAALSSTNINSADFAASFEPMSFVADWDNRRSAFRL